jgi:hypothetical protein
VSNDNAPRPSGQPDQRSLHAGCFAETLAEIGWTPKYIPLDPTKPSAAVVPVGVAGHNDRYFAGPNYLHPELGCMLQDYARSVYLIVRDVPTPREAAKLLAKHGISLEGEQSPSWGRQQLSS